MRIQVINPAVKAENIKLRVAALDKSMLRKYSDTIQNDVHVTAKGRRYSVTATSKKDGQYLFLPITYDASMRCRVNGKSQKLICALDNFSAVKLEKGTNSIELTFLPKGFIAGICITVSSLILCVLWMLKQKFIEQKTASGKFGSFVLGAYYVADIAALAALYIAPMIGKLYTLIAGG